MGGSSKKVTVGYRYYMGLHFGICHGPIDALGEIRVGDRVAWQGAVDISGPITINAPQLFGGDEREGGVQGTADVMMGEESQTANSYLSSKIAGLMPAFRGIVSLVFRGGLIGSNNPYVKPWAFKVTRITDDSGGGAGPGKSYMWDTPPGILYEEEGAFTITLYGIWSVIGGGSVTTDHDSFYKALHYVINNLSGPGALSGGDSPTKRGYIFDDDNQEEEVDVGLRPIGIHWRDPGTEVARFTIVYTSTRDLGTYYPLDEDTYDDAENEFPETERPYKKGAMMNPASIIYQCLTNTDWGMGLSPLLIDDDAFQDAADTLYGEVFGLGLLWNQQTKIGEFVQLVLDHIAGVLYSDPRTGKFVLKLIRGDYETDDLDVFNETNIVRLESFQRAGYGETVNEITVVYTDNNTDKDASITVQNLANIQAQGAVVSQRKPYPGIRYASLAARVAERDLIASSTTLAKATIRVNRTAWSQVPGGVIKLSWAKLGIEELICRVLAVNYGTLTDGTITIELAEDVFGLPESSYSTEQPSGWEVPNNSPAVATNRVVEEAGYYQLLQQLSTADMEALADDAGYLSTTAARPSNDALDYGLYTDEGSGYTEAARGDFCPSGTLVAGIGHTDTDIEIEALTNADLITTGTYALLDDELVRIDAFDADTGEAEIGRGLHDSVAATHATGARLYFLDGYTDTDGVERVDAETVDVKLLPKTGLGQLSEASAPADTVTFDQRQFRPYPPGQFQINTESYPTTISEPASLVIDWAHRDRLQQNLEGDETGDIGPEAGTTYSLTITNADTEVVVYSTTGVSGASHTVATPLYGDYVMRIELWSVRDSLDSRQRHNYEFAYERTAVTDPSFSSVTLLLGCEGSGGSTTFTDESSFTNNMTASGNAQVDTAQFKYGTASLLLDGTGDYLSRADDADFGFGTGDFTVELWLRRDSGTSGDYPLFDFRASGSQNGMFYLSPTNRRLTYYNGSTYGNTGSAPSASTWAHVAFSRASGTLRAYLDGVEQWNTSMSGDFGSSRPLKVGANFTPSAYANGHMDEIRVTKGVARYTTNFTPPAAAHPRS